MDFIHDLLMRGGAKRLVIVQYHSDYDVKVLSIRQVSSSLFFFLRKTSPGVDFAATDLFKSLIGVVLGIQCLAAMKAYELSQVNSVPHHLHTLRWYEPAFLLY